ncbi:hypothetical protein [Streptomyces decoyicus]|uniref:hypothetical protein n=1 Tax=Streptomyces decoyicus TaxID=249567 RepID=UPI00365B423B
MTEDSNQKPAKKAAKKTAAKRITQLRRPDNTPGALLGNPALGGVKETVSRSFIGQGQRIPAPATPDDAEVENASAHDPSGTPTAPSAQAAPAEVEDSTSASPTSAPQTAPSAQAAPAEVEDSTSASPTSAPQTAPSTESTTTAGDTPAAKPGIDRGRRGDGDHVTAETTGDQPPETRKSPANRPAAARGRRKLSAQQNLEKSYTESVIDLRLRKKDWAAHPFRFTPDLITQMNTRAAKDSASTGLSLTSAQYVHAAMAMHLPDSLDEQLELAEGFLRDMGARRIPEGQQSSYRVGPEVLAVVRPLSNHLKAAGKARTGYHIYSAVLSRFMKDLEAEGPLSFDS